MKNSTRNLAEGAFHEVKGKIKEIAGKLGKDYKLESKGKGEKGWLLATWNSVKSCPSDTCLAANVFFFWKSAIVSIRDTCDVGGARYRRLPQNLFFWDCPKCALRVETYHLKGGPGGVDYGKNFTTTETSWFCNLAVVINNYQKFNLFSSSPPTLARSGQSISQIPLELRCYNRSLMF